MKKFIGEFKTFITRGNVVDMAVGVIVGSAFTAIVNGLSGFILKPAINALMALIFGADTLSDLYTVLRPAYQDGVLDLANSIYIDWGAFIETVLNFFIVAFVLFTLVKLINRVRAERREVTEKMMKGIPARADRKLMRAEGISLHDKEAVAAFYARRTEKEPAAKAAAEEAAAAEAAAARAANPTAEDLLRDILAELRKKA